MTHITVRRAVKEPRYYQRVAINRTVQLHIGQ